MLHNDDETFRVYPYKFEIIVKYTLQEKQLKTQHIVLNPDDKNIYFQIGGHPAFNYPNYPFSKGYLQLTKDGEPLNEISVKRPNSNGYITNNIQHIELSNGCSPLKDDIFDSGALVLENNQCDEISMINGNGQTHLTLKSDAKVFGIWSPERKNALFICLEPWHGRADNDDYQDDFKDRQFMNILAKDEKIAFEYSIVIQ